MPLKNPLVEQRYAYLQQAQSPWGSPRPSRGR
jgi:hypothetical protein